MKEFEVPVVEIITLSNEDIIVTSGCTPPQYCQRDV